ncbi:MAG TPA: hypothetical protein VF039_14515 [Longimicrobiales bacterium]
MAVVRRLALALVLAAVAPAPRPLAAQSPADTAAVLATVQELFDAMAARDSVALASLVTRPGVFAVVVVDHDTVITVQHQSLATLIDRIGEPGPALLERSWEPRVMIDGPFAAVWTPYDFHIGGRFNHCGVDVFTLARDAGRWRVTGGSYTIQQQECAPSPLGAP